VRYALAKALVELVGAGRRGMRLEFEPRRAPDWFGPHQSRCDSRTCKTTPQRQPHSGHRRAVGNERIGALNATRGAAPGVLFACQPLCWRPNACNSNHYGTLTRWSHVNLRSGLGSLIFGSRWVAVKPIIVSERFCNLVARPRPVHRQNRAAQALMPPLRLMK
jgi:hypothetical protein